MEVSTGVNKLLSFGYRVYKSKRVLSVLEDLAHGRISLNEGRNKEDEIYRFNLFLESLERAATYKKMEVLKNFYLKYHDEANYSEEANDEYFETLSILNELSEREMLLIYLLDKVKTTPRLLESYSSLIGRGMNGGTGEDRFYYYAADLIKVKPEMVEALLKRVERTGLIDMARIDRNARFTIYKHTELYKSIRSKLFDAIESPYSQSLKVSELL